MVIFVNSEKFTLLVKLFFINAFFQGYFRKAEVEYATHQYEDALMSYRKALQLSGDPNLLQYINKTTLEEKKAKRSKFYMLDYSHLPNIPHFPGVWTILDQKNYSLNLEFKLTLSV